MGNVMIFETISDDELRNAILERFSADTRTASTSLRVGVLNGIVHLAGSVSSLEIWIAAAELAGETPGIRGVVNRIKAPNAPKPARTIHLNLTPSKKKQTK